MLTEEKFGGQDMAGITINIEDVPVMESALNVLTVLNKKSSVVLKAKGGTIPNAVAVANIITENILRGSSKVQKITLDTDEAPGIGEMLSTIEIIVSKI